MKSQQDKKLQKREENLRALRGIVETCIEYEMKKKSIGRKEAIQEVKKIFGWDDEYPSSTCSCRTYENMPHSLDEVYLAFGGTKKRLKEIKKEANEWLIKELKKMGKNDDKLKRYIDERVLKKLKIKPRKGKKV